MALRDEAQAALLTKIKARGRVRGQHKPGEMNKLEAEYADHLEMRKIAGAIAWWKFEAVRLKLAPNTTYTPDFMVMNMDGLIECHETKGGFWRDDARCKVKIAAELFPFRFIGVQKVKGGWQYENFGE